MRWRPRSRSSRPLTRRLGDEGSPGLQRLLSAHAGTRGGCGIGAEGRGIVVGELMYGHSLRACRRPALILAPTRRRGDRSPRPLFQDSGRIKVGPIPTNDVRIAAHAMETGADLVSADGHFETLKGLLGASGGSLNRCAENSKGAPGSFCAETALRGSDALCSRHIADQTDVNGPPRLFGGRCGYPLREAVLALPEADYVRFRSESVGGSGLKWIRGRSLRVRGKGHAPG